MKKSATPRNAGKHPNPPESYRFKKGDDPRRWKHGQKSKATVTVSRDIQQWLSLVGEEICETGQTYSEALARKLWEKSIRGDLGAAQIILERILGKAPQPLSGNLTISGKLSIDEMKKSAKETGDANANG